MSCPGREHPDPAGRGAPADPTDAARPGGAVAIEAVWKRGYRLVVAGAPAGR